MLPLGLITALLLWNYSPVLVGVAGTAAVVVASLLRKHTRIGLRQLVEGLKQGAMLAISISIACAVAGIVVGVIGQTGVGLTIYRVCCIAQQWPALVGFVARGHCRPGTGYGFAGDGCLYCLGSDDRSGIARAGFGVNHRAHDYILAVTEF